MHPLTTASEAFWDSLTSSLLARTESNGSRPRLVRACDELVYRAAWRIWIWHPAPRHDMIWDS
jgi:hypothetical protein